ncbi:diguanylate cyclase [Stappia sp. F7233]|uniref:diguanylate cyclase n=1 Tax=Stappia albiluteola TaxID=2758565 RepID=A0A839AH32_9HYPH|nr:diguanylate cyclase [Stappia albiluteola]MBA5778396.1 diguanylate cyclase [Stappia albiluteola]
MQYLQSGVIAQMIGSLGLAALVALTYSLVIRPSLHGRLKILLAGILFGGAAIASMLNPIVFAPGLLIDARGVMVTLAAPFGGWIAAVIAGSMAALFRISEGGTGVIAGSLGIVGATVAGIFWSRIFPGGRNLTHLALYGANAALFQILGLLALPGDLAWTIIERFAFPLGAINLAGVFIVGLFLRWEEKRSMLMQNAQIAAQTDWLTQLSNRRRLEDVEKSLRGRLKGDDASFAVALFDIDFFKRVNDMHGHAAGDKVIARVAEIIREMARREDEVIRYGGEEYAVLMLGAKAHQALQCADRIRRLIEATTISLPGAEIRITISAGVASMSSSHGTASLASLIEEADAALYRAKESGRNKVVSVATDKSGERVFKSPAGTHKLAKDRLRSVS